jgi:cell division protein FtsZ
MAIGSGRGEHRAVDAARAAISSPLLDVSIEGARGLLINVSGGPDLTLMEVSEAANTIAEVVDPSANIIFGAVVLPRPQPDVEITLIATGLRNEPARQPSRAPDVQTHPEPAARSTPRVRSAPPSYDEDDDSDLDLPAFMRRRRGLG